MIDSPAGIESGFRNAAVGADEALVIATPEVPAVRDADRIIGLLESMGKAPIRLIVNRLRAQMVRDGEMLDVSDVLDILAIELIGVVPEDDSVVKSANRGEPLTFSDSSPASLAFQRIAMRLTGKEVAFRNSTRKRQRTLRRYPQALRDEELRGEGGWRWDFLKNSSVPSGSKINSKKSVSRSYLFTTERISPPRCSTISGRI